MKKLSVVAVNGSPHQDGNTSILIRHILVDHEVITWAKEAGQNMAWLLKTITSKEQTEDNS